MREPSTSIPAFEAVPPALLWRRHPYVQIARATVTRPWLWFWPVEPGLLCEIELP